MFTEGHEIQKVDKTHVGDRIKQVRKSLQLTQEQFGAAVGYCKTHIHYVEAGKVVPSNELLRHLADVFSINYEWLLTGVGKIEAEEANVDDALIEWLRKNPEVVKELRIRGGLD